MEAGERHGGDAGSGDAPDPGGAPRLRPGELDGLVLVHLSAHPEEAPTGVAKALRRSSGAVQSCLERLAGRGEVTRVGTRPRRYGVKKAG